MKISEYENEMKESFDPEVKVWLRQMYSPTGGNKWNEGERFHATVTIEFEKEDADFFKLIRSASGDGCDAKPVGPFMMRMNRCHT
jgi:hypothetical protein